MCVHRESSPEWSLRRGGGGADLCVRSAGYSSEITRTAGQPNHLDRESRSASLRRHHPNGTRDRMAGGRTSVSAPLDVPPRVPAATGHPTAWIGNPNVRPSRDIARMEPKTGWRVGTAGFRSRRSAAQRDGYPPIQTQRSGHRGPPPRDPLCGPWPRGALGAGSAEIPMHAVLAARWDGCPPIQAQWSGHRGPPPPQPAVRSLATGGFGSGLSGETDACGLAARWDCWLAIQTQRADRAAHFGKSAFVSLRQHRPGLAQLPIPAVFRFRQLLANRPE
jgi:hypothetical protein